jgi:hypothetical protein
VDAPVTVLISDTGMASTADEVSNDVDRGQRVLVFDPLFFGENTPGTAERPYISNLSQMLNSIRERLAGLEAAQIAAVISGIAEIGSGQTSARFTRRRFMIGGAASAALGIVPGQIKPNSGTPDINLGPLAKMGFSADLVILLICSQTR